ncbi:UDP-N-acetylglucosamine transferase subunit ALG13 homolog [Contarinia nasturtii]|uniref:UDP-N-acetylglucosamine transferase subunit ALG13 homolog n=1 Tax=Contarinia nasturtii TaxID=265458 RepID=UPI0012D436F4|nr:UDP-N-acetylglucosamine transferase subunit ALG13 homolog [Contarinia nasturtii]
MCTQQSKSKKFLETVKRANNLKMQSFASVFVTVGTTQFDDLIDVILTDDVLTLLQRIQCKLLKIQYGAGKQIDSTTIDRIERKFSIKIQCYDFKANILADITSSDLVISHAGAGSCIEVLTSKIPLIVVVNDQLMHNHQTELAQQLFNDSHLLYCSPSTLTETLDDIGRKVSSLKPYEAGHNNMTKFVNHLSSLMGFE